MRTFSTTRHMIIFTGWYQGCLPASTGHIGAPGLPRCRWQRLDRLLGRYKACSRFPCGWSARLDVILFFRLITALIVKNNKSISTDDVENRCRPGVFRWNSISSNDPMEIVFNGCYKNRQDKSIQTTEWKDWRKPKKKFWILCCQHIVFRFWRL